MLTRLRNLKASLDAFRTTSKIVVFESDDWGMDRMPSRQMYEELAAEGCIDTADPFNRDGRERVEDLAMLYDVLGKFRDAAGRPPVLTANFVMANPDFETIERSGYRHYSWITIDDFARRPSQEPVVDKIKEGIDRGLMSPQYHGRDHFSAEAWLRALRGGDPVSLAGFRRGVVLAGLACVPSSEYGECYDHSSRALPRAAIDAKTEAGIRIFEEVFGSRPMTSIAPFYLWSEAVEVSLFARGVRCMQAARNRPALDGQSGALVRRSGAFGGRTASGMVYLTRNCRFEPSQDGDEAVGRCLEQIQSMFARGYPAVIDSHRVNYVGIVDPAMRDVNLALLRNLLGAILHGFPGVRFATSTELAASFVRDSNKSANSTRPAAAMHPAPVARRVFWTVRERYDWWRAKGNDGRS